MINQPTLETMPEFLSAHQLVTLGLYPSVEAAYSARLRGKSSSFIKIGSKILYRKLEILRFIEERLQNGNIPYCAKGK